jgi:hypothetical protein
MSVDAERTEPEAAPKPPRKRAVKKPAKKAVAGTKAPRKRRDIGITHDWIMLRTAYIEGIPVEGSDERQWLTLTQMSEKFTVARSALYDRAGDEQWNAQREAYQHKIAKQRQARRIAMLAKESEAFDSKAISLANDGMDIVMRRVREINAEIEEQEVRKAEALVKMARGEDVPLWSLQSVIDAKELNELSKAALGWQQLGQKAMGADVIKVEIAHDIHASIDMDVEVTSIASELGRDDPERLAAFLQAAKRAGILDSVMNQKEIEQGDDEVVEAEIVEEAAS